MRREHLKIGALRLVERTFIKPKYSYLGQNYLSIGNNKSNGFKHWGLKSFREPVKVHDSGHVRLLINTKREIQKKH